MSHELTQRKDGFVEMAYVGEMPWHKLGQELQPNAPMETWITQAGMDWQIKRSRVRFGDGTQLFDDHHVLFRSDTKEPLAVVGKKYQIVQPAEHLEFFRDLVDAGGFKLEAAGTLFGGRRFWATAAIGETALILGQDKVSGYLLLTGSCDGTMPTQAKPVATRAICNNTIQMALRESGRAIKVSHRTSFNAAAIKAELGIVQGAFGDFVQASRLLSLTPLKLDDAKQLTGKLLIDSKTVTKDDVETSSGFKSILSLFDHGKGNHGATAWDWVNGVTEYVDHVQRAKSESHRMANSQFGKGDALKTMAFQRAMALAD